MFIAHGAVIVFNALIGTVAPGRQVSLIIGVMRARAFVMGFSEPSTP
jgi:hypothetical protein